MRHTKRTISEHDYHHWLAFTLGAIALLWALCDAANADAIPAVQDIPDAPSTTCHFVTRAHASAWMIDGAGKALDAWGSDRTFAVPGSGEEHDPIAKPFMGSRGGRVVYFAGSYALDLGIAYAFHRTRHHRLEKLTPFIGAAISFYSGVYTVKHYREFPRTREVIPDRKVTLHD